MMSRVTINLRETQDDQMVLIGDIIVLEDADGKFPVMMVRTDYGTSRLIDLTDGEFLGYDEYDSDGVYLSEIEEDVSMDYMLIRHIPANKVRIILDEI